MSNPNQQNPQGPWPIYGQGSGSQPADTGAGQGAWPVYGQPDTSSGQPGPAGQSPAGAYAPGQYPPGQYSPGHYPPTTGDQPPAGGPFQTPQYGSGGAGAYPTPRGPVNPAGNFPQQLPSRTAPILLIVLGAVMMLLIAPVVMVAVLLSGVGLNQIVDQSLQTTNGGAVTVDATGTLGVITTSNGPVTCALENQAGSTQMIPEVDGAMLVARNLTPGEYVLNCEGLSASDAIVVLDGGALESVFPATMTAFGWATAVGVLGLGVLIGGIVWLVKRNKARKAMMPRHPTYGGPGSIGPGNPGAGGYGGPPQS